MKTMERERERDAAKEREWGKELREKGVVEELTGALTAVCRELGSTRWLGS